MIVCVSFLCDAQTSYEDFKKKSRNDYESFRKKSKDNYDSFRKKANDNYAKFLEKAWGNFNALKSPIKEDKTPTPPLPYDDKPIEDNTNPIKDVVKPTPPAPQPKPIEPIKETPKEDKWFAFSFLGTNLKVRLDDKHKPNIGTISERNIASVWANLSQDKFNNTIKDCLDIRTKNSLCDWAYLLMLNELSETYAGKGTNEATLLMAYIYCQSGYKMRLGYDNGKLYMLYASKHYIYGSTYFIINGENFYVFNYSGDRLCVSEAAFPNEQAMSLYIDKLPSLGVNSTPKRELQSKRYESTNANTSVNPNLIEFYNTYPTSQIGDNFMTRWEMYANTPLSQNAKNTLYPALKQAIAGVDQLEAVNRILNFVQTAFVYEYDDKVWGHDRAFFADETLYYPYCDCEDRSILFSRLIRDLLGLEVTLVYYPGHLATAVHFTTDVKGDNFILNGKKFVICDPTYINALVGASMPQFHGSKDISVILLE